MIIILIIIILLLKLWLDGQTIGKSYDLEEDGVCLIKAFTKKEIEKNLRLRSGNLKGLGIG